MPAVQTPFRRLDQLMLQLADNAADFLTERVCILTKQNIVRSFPPQVNQLKSILLFVDENVVTLQLIKQSNPQRYKEVTDEIIV